MPKTVFQYMTKNKILLFEYAIHRLMEWRKEVMPGSDIESYFTRLTSLKLIFLLSATKDMQNGGKDLLTVFDKYCAMQYGPVEVDIYSAIVYKKTSFFDFGNYALIEKKTPDFSSLPESLKNQVDRGIVILKSLNPRLISLRASQLVDITHKWAAWRIAIGTAELLGQGSEAMSVESIRSSQPFYE